MNIVPERLIGLPYVKLISRDKQNCILEKKLTEPLARQEGYVASHVILILLSGRQVLESVDGEIFHLKAGDILSLPRGLYYITDVLSPQNEFHSVLFYFDSETVQKFLVQSDRILIHKERSKQTFFKSTLNESISSYLNSLLKIYRNSVKPDSHLLRLKIMELFHLIQESNHFQDWSQYLQNLSRPSKRSIAAFMKDYFDKPLKVEDYAYLTGRSVSTFRREFKSQFMSTPNAWLKNMRIQKALSLLEKEPMSVTQLAFEVGYQNVSYFIKEFKVQIGQSPKQFILKKHRNTIKA